MEIHLKDQNGVIFKTANTYCEEDIEVKVDTEELNILPSTEDQISEGLYNKVTVPGSPDLLPENIVEGKEIFGKTGTAKAADFKITSGSYLFYNGNRLDYMNEILALCDNITSASFMFSACSNLTELDLSNLNTSEVTDMKYMFGTCNNISKLNLSNFNTSKVTDMEYMFNYCNKALTELDLSSFDTSNVEYMGNMFNQCCKLTKINLSNFNTSKVEQFTSMFSYCYALTELDLSHFDTTSATNLNNMFYECKKLQSIDVSSFNTTNVTHFSYVFYNCKLLTELDLSGFDLSKAYYILELFTGCEKLSTIRSFRNLGKGYKQKSNEYKNYALSFYKCDLLSRESLLDIITNGLYDLNLTYDVANGGTLYRQKLIIGATNIAKLTEEEIQIAIDKGWNVS